ncbi:bacterio-opsin activator [halophilic archaeon]|nr:bacterio-opsin activator [halophilic archaeon]
MVVITDITVPADQFALGQLLDEYPDIEIELERIVPLREGVIPLFWVEGGKHEDIIATLQKDPLTEDVQYLTEADGRYLFEIRWNPKIDALIKPMIESKAEVLRGEGEVDKWEFRLQFDNRDQLRTFRESCQANDVQIELDALYNPTMPVEEHGELTDEQYDVIETAYRSGFWDVPRGTTLSDLAGLIGISSNAASERMRRALNRLVGEYLAEQRLHGSTNADNT